MACKHEYYMHRGRRLLACDCVCKSCHDGRECICNDCSHDPEVHIDPQYYKKIEKEDREKTGNGRHFCLDCGEEVFRKTNRGRWPLRCADCKAKRQ